MAIDVDIRTDVGVIFYLDRAFCDSIVQYFDSLLNKDLKEKNVHLSVLCLKKTTSGIPLA